MAKEKTIEANTEMDQMLELSDRDFKITMINMLQDLQKKWTTWEMLKKNRNASNKILDTHTKSH